MSRSPWSNMPDGGDAAHRAALRDAIKHASRRERNYDQPWWAVNMKLALDYIEELESLTAELQSESQATLRLEQQVKDLQAELSRLRMKRGPTILERDALAQQVKDLTAAISRIGYEVLEGDFVLRDGSHSRIYLARAPTPAGESINQLKRGDHVRLPSGEDAWVADLHCADPQCPTPGHVRVDCLVGERVRWVMPSDCARVEEPTPVEDTK